jgi:NADH-quinone oxidoreductase subunit I
MLAWINGIYEGLASFVVGMRTTMRFLVENMRDQGGATAMTRQYPQQPAEVIGDRVRGHLVNDSPRCIVCFACERVCPVDCFVMEGERDGDNKMHASRFDIDLSKCIYCGLCVRACPTDSLSMTSQFELDPVLPGVGRYLFRRTTGQLDQRLDTGDVARLTRLANAPRDSLSAEDRAWLDARVDPAGPHLIGMYGLGYYTADEKAAADAARAAKKKKPAAAPAPAAAPSKPQGLMETPPPFSGPAEPQNAEHPTTEGKPSEVEGAPR